MFINKSFIKKKYKEYRFVFFVFILWKLVLTVLGVYLAKILEFNPTYPYFENLVREYGLLSSYVWGGFDGVHYLNIASDGYANQYTQAFFPFYPLLINILSFGVIPKLFIGIAINNICLLVSLIYIQKIVKKYFIQIEYKIVILLILCYPFSFFFNSVYNEGLFLMLTTASFYYFFIDRIFLSVGFGVFATTTRLAGIFILPALMITYFYKRKKTILPVFLIPLGLASYMIFLQIKYGDFLYFIHAQNYFGNSRSSDFVLLPQVIFRYFKILTTVSLTSNAFVLALTEIFITLSFLAIPMLFIKKLPKPLIVYTLLVVLVPSLTGTFSSMPRYALTAFPAFICIAYLKPLFIYPLLVLFILLQIFFLSLFVSGTFVS